MKIRCKYYLNDTYLLYSTLFYSIDRLLQFKSKRHHVKALKCNQMASCVHSNLIVGKAELKNIYTQTIQYLWFTIELPHLIYCQVQSGFLEHILFLSMNLLHNASRIE